MEQNIVTQYMREIARHPLLSYHEEQELAMHVEEARAAHAQLETEIDERTRRQLTHIINRGKDAADKLIQSNLRLVSNVAKNHTNRGVDLLDLMQEGTFGLMRAVEKFERKHGTRFATYANWWILQFVRRCLARDSRSIRIPGHIVDALARISKVTETLVGELGRQPTAQEIAIRSNEGWTADFVDEVLKFAESTGSFDSAIGDTDFTLEDVTVNEATEEPGEALEQMYLEGLIEDALGTLTEREYVSIRLYHGFVDGTPRNSTEIAKFMNVSNGRITQLIKAATAKLTARLAGEFS
jgi:RNA polymerase primary sigma factor